jgi:16S rRNA (cytosine967-C5)-methyltransferase
LSPHRLDLIRRNSERLGMDIVEVKTGDATNIDNLQAGSFDKVLVDAPCSGLGVLARRPDSRWRKSPAQIEELSVLQSHILASAASFVGKDGALVYSVCTISHQESAEVIEGFLQSHPEFVLDDAARFLPGPLMREEPYNWIQLLPHKHGTDGMYIARMVRK